MNRRRFFNESTRLRDRNHRRGVFMDYAQILEMSESRKTRLTEVTNSQVIPYLQKAVAAMMKSPKLNSPGFLDGLKFFKQAVIQACNAEDGLEGKRGKDALNQLLWLVVNNPPPEIEKDANSKKVFEWIKSNQVQAAISKAFEVAVPVYTRAGEIYRANSKDPNMTYEKALQMAREELKIPATVKL